MKAMRCGLTKICLNIELNMFSDLVIYLVNQSEMIEYIKK